MVSYWKWIALVLVVTGILGAVIVLVHFATDVNVRIILSDPAETALLPEYAGWYSHIGVLVLWASSIFGLVSSRFGSFQSGVGRRFVRSFAVILGLIARDDLFLIHEWLGLKLAQLTKASDIASARSALEAIVFASYIAIGAFWVWAYRSSILRGPWPLFALGGLGFGGSILLDLLPYVADVFEPDSLIVETSMAVLEDLLKLVGIGGLALFGYLIALPHLQSQSIQTDEGRTH